MTILNEAVRLFLAVSALILVGMLSAPAGGNLGKNPEEISPAKLMTSTDPKIQPKGKNAIKISDRKSARKIAMKKG